MRVAGAEKQNDSTAPSARSPACQSRGCRTSTAACNARRHPAKRPREPPHQSCHLNSFRGVCGAASVHREACTHALSFFSETGRNKNKTKPGHHAKTDSRDRSPHNRGFQAVYGRESSVGAGSHRAQRGARGGPSAATDAGPAVPAACDTVLKAVQGRRLARFHRPFRAA